MTRIVIVAKNGGDLLQDTQASEVVLSQPSVVQIGVTKDAVASITREGNHVVVVLKNGEKIVIDNFFNDANNADNSLVFPEQDKGFALVEFDSANGAVNYLGLDNLEPLLYSNDTAGLIAWLFPVVTAGGILWWAHRDHDSHKDQSSPTAKATLTSITDDTGVSSTDLITNDKTLILSGKVTQPLATDETVQISLDGGKTWLNTVVDRNNGSWSFDNTHNPLVDGVYTVQVRTVDGAGNIGPISEQKITIDTTSPVDGSLTEAKLLDDVGAVTGEIKDGSTTDDTRPEYTGTATPDVEHVNVYDKGGLIGTATVKADGTWTFTPTTPLASGPHTFTAKPVDKAGNEGVATDPIDFNVIGSVPLVPTIEMVTDNAGDVTGALKKGSTTDDKTPIVSGTAQPGTIVHVYSNGKDVGSVGVKPDGTWALEVADLGTDGEKKLTAVAQDPAGQMSPSTGEYPIILDSTAPAKPQDASATDNVGPTIGEIPAGGTTDDNTPTITGKGEPGATVEVIDNGQPLGTTTVDSAGNWTYTPDTPLTDGPHEITTTQTDPAGNTSEPSDPLVLTVDTTPSAKPEGVGATDNVGPNVGEIPPGGTTDDNTPTITGKGEPGATVEVIDNGQPLGTTTVDSAGSWTYTPDTPLTDGPHEITTTQTDPAGNTSEPSDPLVLTVDTTPPAKPEGVGATDNVGANVGEIPSGGTTDDNTPTITGKGEPGATVEVIDNGQPIGTTTVDSAGNWTFTPETPLTDGPHEITSTQTDPAGNTSEPSDPLVLNVDTTAPKITAEITGITEDTGLANDYLTNDQSLVISGKVSDATQVQVGDKVQVRVDGGTWADATLKADGTWSLDNTANPLAEGKHVVEARVVDQAGNATAPTSKEITIDKTAPVDGSLIDAKLLDDVGPVTGEIQEGTTTDDTRPEYTGQATPDVEHVNVYDKGGLIGTATVQPDGTWAFTPELPLIGGGHSFTAKPVDKAGNEGTATDPIDFNVIGSAPLAPTIQSVDDNVGDVTGPLQKGATTDDNTPTVSGTAQPGTTVHVYSNGTEVGSVAVKPDGTWTLEVADLGADGEKKLTAVARDPAGQVSPATGEYPIILDTTAPSQPADITATDDVGPTIGEIPAGGTTDDTTPTITGTGEPGATVEVIDNGQPLGTTTVDSAGNWTFTPDTPLTNGPHEITTTQTDPAGNSSDPSDPLNFIVDTSASSIQITNFIDNTTPIEGNIAKAGVTNDNTPTIVGISEPNATISITDENGQVVGTATTDATGKWSVELAQQAEGEHSYTATAQLPNGSTATDTAKLTIDTTAPIAPTIDSVTDDVGEKQGPLTTGGTTDDTTPTITGQAEPDNVVTIYADGKPVGSVVADPNGNWNYTLPSPGLTEGLHDLTVTQTDPAGNESAPTAPFEVIVDTTAPTITAEITGITEDTGLANDYLTNDQSLVISGKVSDATQVQVGDKVQVRVDGGTWADATLKADGTWSLDNTANPLAEGKHVVEARVVDQAGNATAPTSKEITIDKTAPVDGSLIDAKLLDDVGAVTGQIQDGTDTDDTRPEYTGQATPDVEHVNVYDKGGLIGTATVQPDGTWTFTPENPLTSGPHEFSAKPVDKAGNEGNSTSAIAFTIIGEPPQEPAITQVQDDFGPEVGDLQKGQSTDDKTPTVSGTGQAGSVVHVFVDGTEVGSTTVNPDETWSMTLPDLGADGEKKITANATDGAGQVSTTTDAYPIVLDTMAPTNSGFTATDDVGTKTGPIANGDTIDDTVPTLTGTGVPGDLVKVYDNGTPIGSATVDSTGHWKFIPSPELENGPHELETTHTDPAGNESAKSDPLAFIVDTGVPVIKIESVTDNIGITETIAKNGLTNDNTPTFAGTTNPNQVVTITDKAGTPITSVTADATGKWSVDLPQQVDGVHDYIAKVTLPNGQTASDSFALNIDTAAPSKPAFDANDDVGPSQSVLQSGDTTDDATPTLTGTGQAGDKVTIYDHGQPIGTTSVKPDGTWSYTPTTLLAEGPHSLEVTHTDPAGNESPKSDPLDIQVDTSTVEITIDGIEDDQLPVIETVAKGGITNDETPIIFGTTKPDSVVTINDSNGQAIGSTVADSSGQWSVTLPTQPEGHHEYTAVAELPNGQKAEAKVDFTIDITAPTQPSFVATDDVAPSVGDIESGDTTDDTTPTLTGTGEAGDKVTIYDHGQPVGTTTVKPDGTWSFTPTTPLTEGPHSLEITQTDPAGNESDKSTPLDFTVSTAVATVNIETATDNKAPKTGPISDGGLTNDDTPVLSGTATANQVVMIKDQTDTVIGSATADATGQWSIELPQQTDGEHTYTASVTLANGSTAQSQYSLEIDATTPAQLTIDSVSDDVGVVQGLLTSGDSTDDKTPTLQGTAEAGNVVTIYDEGKPVGSVTAGPNGHWNYTIPAPGLTEGSHNLTATQTDPAGNVSTPSSPFNVVIDITAPTITAEITGITEDSGLATDFLTNDPSLVISGKVSDATQLQAGDKVQVRIDGGAWKDATLNADGTWSLDNTANVLTDGKHTIDARVIDKAGNYTAPSTKEVTIDTEVPVAPTLDNINDDVAPVTGSIADGDTTNDQRPELTGTGEAGNSISIYDNGVEIGTAVVDSTGNWSFTPSTDLADGPHAIEISQKDAAGNESPKTTPVNFTVDTVAPPAAPTLDNINDDVAPVTGSIADGDTTNDQRPELTGTGEAGNSISIYDNGVEIGTAVVDSTGNWSFTPTTDLADGPHAIEISQKDAAGNESPKTTPVNFTVDTVAPTSTVEILGITDDSGVSTDFITNDNTLLFNGKVNGTLGADEKVQISLDGGVTWKDAVSNTNGTWTFDHTANPLADGTYTVQAHVVDQAGNVGATDTQDVIVDTTISVPAPAISMSNYEDNGVSSTDFYSNDTQFTLNVIGEAGVQVIYQTLKDGTWTDLNTATIAAAANNTSSYDVDWSALQINDQSRKFRAVITDVAGNSATVYVGGADETAAQNYRVDNVAATGQFTGSKNTSQQGGSDIHNAALEFSETGERYFKVYEQEYRGQRNDGLTELTTGAGLQSDANGKLDLSTLLTHVDNFKNYVFETVDNAGNLSISSQFIQDIRTPISEFNSDGYSAWYYQPYSYLREFSASAFMEMDGIKFYNDSGNLAGFATRYDGGGYVGETQVYLTLGNGTELKTTVEPNKGYWEFSYNGSNPVPAGEIAGLRLVPVGQQYLTQHETADYRYDVSVDQIIAEGENAYPPTLSGGTGSYNFLNSPVQYIKGQADTTGSEDWRDSLVSQEYTSTRDNDAIYSNGVATTLVYKVLDTITTDMNSGGAYLGETGTTIGLNGYGSQFDLGTFGNSNLHGWIDRDGNDFISVGNVDLVDINGDGVYDGSSGDTATQVTDLWNHFDETKDKLDISDWITKIEQDTGVTITDNNIAQYLTAEYVTNAETNAVSTVLSIDRDGAGTNYASSQFLILEATNNKLELADLLNNNIILH